MKKLAFFERRRIAEAFKACKPLLWNGEADLDKIEGGCRYICNALSESGAGYAYLAREIVMERLGGSNTVDAWLANRKIYRGNDDRKIQAFRHRWVDELIKEFSK